MLKIWENANIEAFNIKLEYNSLEYYDDFQICKLQITAVVMTVKTILIFFGKKGKIFIYLKSKPRNESNSWLLF